MRWLWVSNTFEFSKKFVEKTTWYLGFTSYLIELVFMLSLNYELSKISFIKLFSLDIKTT